MKKISFNELHNLRKRFISNNRNKDHIVLHGKTPVLISAPHGVSQVRLGKYKYSEIGSLSTALYLKDNTNSHLIAKTKNNNDDANFDKSSAYKDSIKKLIHEFNIKYLIDIHGLGSSRDCDINLGTHLGKNIKNNIELFNSLNDKLCLAGFKVSIDQPFMAGIQTIAGSINNDFHIWTVQIEINCAITNNKEDFQRYQLLLNTLTDWINSIDK